MTTARLRDSRKSLLRSQLLVNERDGYCCVVCGIGSDIEHQHRLPRGMGGSSRRPEIHSPANLCLLCAEHHRWVESMREASLFMGLLVRRGTDPATVPILTRDGWFLLDHHGNRVQTTNPHERNEA